MKILVNNKTEVTAYVTIGDLPNSIDYDGVVPGDFETKFQPYFYLIQNGQLVVNPDFKELDLSIQSEPTSEQLALTAVAQQMADQQQHIASLEQALTALAKGGTNS